jgi:hypothetical protein
MQRWACATFFESAITISQPEGSIAAITIPQIFKEMLLATATLQKQSQFFHKSATLSMQLEGFTSAIFGIFLAV